MQRRFNDFRRRWSARLAVLFSSLGLAACSTLDPYVGVTDTALVAELHRSYSIEAAETYGEALRTRYRSVRSEQAILSNTASMALIPTAVVATSLAVRGINPNTVLSLSLGAAGAAAGVSLLGLPARGRVYSAGAKAVGCVMDAFADLRTAERAARRLPPAATSPAAGPTAAGADKLVVALARLTTLRDSLAGELNESFFLVLANPTVAAAREAVQRADRTLGEGRAAVDALGRGGIRLAGAFQAVEETVNTAIAATTIQPEVLLAGISGRLTQGAVAFVPRLGPRFEITGSGTRSTPAPEVIRRRLEPQVALLNAAIEEVAAVNRLAGNAPTPDTVRACLTGEELVVRPFVIAPSGRLALTRTQPEEPDVILVTGGSGRYDWGWIGATPPGITGRLIYDQSLIGNLQITVGPGAAAGAWQLFVTDGRSIPLMLEVTFGQAATAVPIAVGRGAGDTGAPAQRDGMVERLQRVLAARGALTSVQVDGQAGPVTAAALLRVLPSATQAEADAILKNPSAIREAANLLAGLENVTPDWRTRIGIAKTPAAPNPALLESERRLHQRYVALGCHVALPEVAQLSEYRNANDAAEARFRDQATAARVTLSANLDLEQLDEAAKKLDANGRPLRCKDA